ncbi:MAG: cytochrome c oxidase subunit II [Anaerolineales bacterium]
MKERTIFIVIILTLVLIAVGYFVATSVDVSWLLPAQASERAVVVDQLFRFMMGIAAVIFLIVEGALVYAVLRFRQKPGDESDAAPIHGNNTLEVVWTLIPAVIVAVIGVYSYRVLTDVERVPDDPLVVRVIGQQFVWQFEYPGSDVTSTVLHLPVDRPVQFQIESRDVIHSFWVPQFRVKRDATPGQIDELVITPSQIGRYPIRCAELCGPGHAAMVSEVVVESPEDFQAWIDAGGVEPLDTAQDVPAGDSLPDDPIAAGRVVFERYGCAACHVLDDANAGGIVGPSLNGIGDRAGARVDGVEAAEYIRSSIVDTDAYVVEGYPPGVMPTDFGERMSDEELNGLVEYLLTQ